MEARGKVARLRAVALFACLAGSLSGTGCFPQATVPLAANGTPMAKVEPENSRPKRSPKAATCVAFGDFRASTATEPGRSPSEREQLREQARRAYQQALETDAHCVPAYLGLARLYQALEDPERALAVYQKGVQALPREASLWYEMGMLQARQKDFAGAEKGLRAAADLDPDNRTYQTTLGYCLARSGRYDDAFQCFRKAGTEAQAHYKVARMMHHNGEDGRAREQLRAALDGQADLAVARQLLDEIDGRAQPANGPALVGFEALESARTK